MFASDFAKVNEDNKESIQVTQQESPWVKLDSCKTSELSLTKMFEKKTCLMYQRSFKH